MNTEVRCILYADDNSHDVELTLNALSEHNIANQVVVMNDGAEVLDYLYRRGRYKDRPDELPALVLLDLKMPRVDGLEALRVIKQDPRLRFLPVVMLTSSREEEDLLRSYSCGANAYVIKPVDFQAFVEAVRQLGIFWTIHNQPPPRTDTPKG